MFSHSPLPSRSITDSNYAINKPLRRIRYTSLEDPAPEGGHCRLRTPTDATTHHGKDLMDITPIAILLLSITLSVIAWLLIGYPIWHVWASRKAGEADLQKANNEQQIQIAVARARFDAAELNKKAAIVEAEAVAEQIKRIGDQLTQHDLFLRWQWIKMMEDRTGETIYVPTEANLPLLEAGRRNTPRPSTITP